MCQSLELKEILRIETTFSSKGEASEFIEELLREKLIACAQSFPIESAYWWKGNIERSSEILVILKLSKENLNEVLKKFRGHPYEIPEITIINVKTTVDYGNWVESVKSI